MLLLSIAADCRGTAFGAGLTDVVAKRTKDLSMFSIEQLKRGDKVAWLTAVGVVGGAQFARGELAQVVKVDSTFVVVRTIRSSGEVVDVRVGDARDSRTGGQVATLADIWRVSGDADPLPAPLGQFTASSPDANEDCWRAGHIATYGRGAPSLPEGTAGPQ